MATATIPETTSLEIADFSGTTSELPVIQEFLRSIHTSRLVVTNPANFLKVRFWQIIDIDRFSAVDPFNTKS
jgi:hypothetical protein